MVVLPFYLARRPAVHFKHHRNSAFNPFGPEQQSTQLHPVARDDLHGFGGHQGAGMLCLKIKFADFCVYATAKVENMIAVAFGIGR